MALRGTRRNAPAVSVTALAAVRPLSSRSVTRTSETGAPVSSSTVRPRPRQGGFGEYQMAPGRTIYRGPDSYLAGGAALHVAPNSHRFSNALDFFHDSEERVATAFAADAEVLRRAGLGLEVELSQPGHIRALVSQGSDSTRIDWAHDSSWRFMPPVRVEGGGYLLHDIDLAINKLLALAGRDEPRDYVDILYVHERVLALGALCRASRPAELLQGVRIIPDLRHVPDPAAVELHDVHVLRSHAPAGRRDGTTLACVRAVKHGETDDVAACVIDGE
jgi:hypothetical protein